MNNSVKYHVTGIGCSAWDLLGVIKNYPHPGEKERFISLEEQCGGQVATALVTVTRLGGKCAIFDTSGGDVYGESIRKNLISEGIDVSYLYTDHGKTSLVSYCMILQDTGERSIFFTTGTKRFMEEEDICPDIILSSKCILTDTHHGKASVKAATIARKGNIPVVTDLERDYGYTEELFRLGTHHILPRDYLLKYTGEHYEETALKSIYNNYKPQVVIVTLGDRGSMAYDKKGLVIQEPYRITQVIDTTGAGDVFHGAFSYGLTLGYDLKHNLEFASIAAGLKCMEMGGQKGIPYKKELEKFWIF